MKSLLPVILSIKAILVNILVFAGTAALLAFGDSVINASTVVLYSGKILSIATQCVVVLGAAVLLRMHHAVYDESQSWLSSRDADAHEKISSLVQVSGLLIFNNIGTAWLCWLVMIRGNEYLFSRALGAVCMSFMFLAAFQALCVMLSPKGLLNKSRLMTPAS